MVEDTSIVSTTEMLAKEYSFSDISFMAKLAEDDPRRERYTEALPSR